MSSSCEVFFLWGCFTERKSSCEVVFLWGLPVRPSSCKVVFLWCHLPVISSSCNVIFLWGHLPMRSSSYEVFFLWGRLHMRSSSYEVLFLMGHFLWGRLSLRSSSYEVFLPVRSSSYDILVWPGMVWHGLIRTLSLNIKFWYFPGWGKPKIKTNSVQQSWSLDWACQKWLLHLFLRELSCTWTISMSIAENLYSGLVFVKCGFPIQHNLSLFARTNNFILTRIHWTLAIILMTNNNW